MLQIHIGRGTTNLGVYEVDQVKAGLATGRFVLTDLGWKEGMTGWKPLSEFAELEEVPTHESVEGDMPDLSALGTPQPGAMQGSEAGLPWDQREQIGFFQAYLQTVKLVLTEPARAFTDMKKEGGLIEPLLFALIGGIIGGIAALIYYYYSSQNPALTEFIHKAFPPNIAAKISAEIARGIGLGSIIWLAMRILLMAFVGSAIFHLGLMLVGGAKRPFETTYRVVCYCVGSTQLLLVIPACGGTISLVWLLIVGVIGLAKAHDTETGRALTAVLLPVICCCAFIFAAVIAVTALGLSAH